MRFLFVAFVLFFFCVGLGQLFALFFLPEQTSQAIRELKQSWSEKGKRRPMKITELALNNIRSHSDTRITGMERIVSIKGQNNAGKSTIEMAIELAMAGRAETTDDRGSHPETLIQIGKDKGLIELTLENTGRPLDIRCSLTEKSGRSLIVKNLNDKTWDPTNFITWLATNSRLLSCLINGRYFIDKEPAEQKSLLASIILPDVYEFDANMVKLAGEANLTIPWDQAPFTVIEKAYDVAYKARTAVNRDIKNWRAVEVPKNAPSLAETRKLIENSQNERSFLTTKRARLVAEHLSVTKDTQAARARLEETDRQLAVERQDQQTLSQDVLSKDQYKQQESIAKQGELGQSLDAQLAKLNTDLSELNAQIDQIQQVDAGAVCPTCTQVISQEFLAGMLGKLIKEKDGLLGDQRQAITRRKQLGDYEGARKRLEAHKVAERDYKRVVERIQSLERRREAEANRIAPATEAPDTVSIDTSLNNLSVAIAKLQDDLVAASNAETLAGQAARAESEMKSYKQQLAALEQLLTYFGPGQEGVKMQLLAEYIKPFEASMNEVLGAWGYQCLFSIEPYGFLVVEEGGKQGRDLRLLSRSERYRFTVAFQVALAGVSGIRFVVIDEADLLLAGNRNSMMAALYNSEHLDQAIVLASDDRQEAPDIPGSLFLYIGAGGEVKVLKHTPAEELKEEVTG